MIDRSKHLVAVGLVLVALALGGATALRRPDRVFHGGFLYADHGTNLLVADRLNDGAILYRDVAYQYGPIPAYAYALVARVFGNTVWVNALWFLVLSAVCIALAYYWLLRHTSVVVAGIVAGAALIPMVLTPGGGIGTYADSAYIPVERLCFLCLLLAWIPPRDRTVRRAVALGLVLGAWQGIKFGGAVFGFAAILLVDALDLVVSSAPGRAWRGAIKSIAITGASAAAVECVYVVAALLFLPLPIARDTIWPAYVIEAYAFVTDAGFARVPSLVMGRAFVILQLAQVACMLAAIVGLMLVVARSRSAGNLKAGVCGAFLGLTFFALAAPFYFGHQNLYYQWAWAAALSSVVLLDRLPRYALAAFALMLLPAMAQMVRADLYDAPPPVVRPVQVDANDTLYLSDPEIETTEAIRALHAELRPPRDAIVFMRVGAGAHTLLGIPIEMRGYYYLRGFVRPYDERELEARLDTIGAIVVIAVRDARPEGVVDYALSPFSPEFAETLRRRLDGPPRVVGGDVWRLTLRQSE